jgi:hypothetical protein
VKNDAQLPRARTEGLIVKELDDETLVYDLKTDLAHCLNFTAARVWKKCDGQTTVTEVLASLSTETNRLVDESLVWLALDQLERFNLLQTAPSPPVEFKGMHRREWVRKIGIAAIAIPAIISITAPVAQAQVSCPATGGGRPPTCPCSGNGNCVSNVCCPDPSPPGLCAAASRPAGTCL